jgi:hypothetical protein
MSAIPTSSTIERGRNGEIGAREDRVTPTEGLPSKVVMADGIAPTDDPVLLFRSPSYVRSYTKRLQGL